jgi:uncharacterized Zn finger protein
MKPTDIGLKDGKYVLTQTCLECGHVRKNKIAAEDNMDKVIELSKNKIFSL